MAVFSRGEVARGDVRLEGAVLLVAQDAPPCVRSTMPSSASASRSRRSVEMETQGVGQLLQRHRAVIVEEVGNALASLNRQQGVVFFLYFARPVFECEFLSCSGPSDCLTVDPVVNSGPCNDDGRYLT